MHTLSLCQPTRDTDYNLNSGYFEVSEVVGIPEINSAVYPIAHGMSYHYSAARYHSPF